MPVAERHNINHDIITCCRHAKCFVFAMVVQTVRPLASSPSEKGANYFTEESCGREHVQRGPNTSELLSERLLVSIKHNC